MMTEFPEHIWHAADETLAKIIEDDLIATEPDDLQRIKRHVALALLAQQERIESAVMAAVARESHECRQAVLTAIHGGVRQ